MAADAAPQTVPVEVPDVTDVPDLDKAWVTIVWNDPVNLMSYVTWVFQKLFGYSREKAHESSMPKGSATRRRRSRCWERT